MKRCVIILWMACWTHLFAQIEVQLPQSPLTTFQVEDFWQVHLRNATSEHYRVYLSGELRDEQNQLVVQARSVSLELAPGFVQIPYGQIPSFDYQWLIEPEELNEGSYQLCLRVILEDFEQTLSQACIMRHIQWPEKELADSSRMEKWTKMAKKARFTGQVSLTGQLSNRQSFFQEVPPNFLRLQASPKFSAYGIPVQANIFLSTEQDGFRYDINTFNLNLDRQELQGQLKQQATQELSQLENLLKMGQIDSFAFQKLDQLREKEIQKLKRQLGPLPDSNQLTLEQGLPELQQLDRIQQLMQHESFEHLDRDWAKLAEEFELPEGEEVFAAADSLCKVHPDRCEEIQSLVSRKEEYEKLKKRYEKLKKLKKEYDRLKQLQQQLKQLESLESGDFRSLLQDPELLKQSGLLSKTNQVLASIKKFGIGVTYPFYSPYSLDGVTVKGLDIAVSPGPFYVAFTGGKLGRAAFASRDFHSRGWLYAGKAGLGAESKNHLFAVFSYSDQEAQSDSISLFKIIPGKNLVYGLSGQLILLGSKVKIQGEWLQSQTQVNISDSSFWEEPLVSDVPLQGRAWNLQGEARFFRDKSRFQGRYSQVDPGYYSAGAPLLITDRERFDFRMEQQLLEGRLQLSVYWRKDADYRQPDLKMNRSLVESRGLSLSIRPKKGPYFQMDYAPYYQQNGLEDSLNLENQISVLTAHTGYHYIIGQNLRGNSTLMYSQQIQESEAQESDFSSFMLTGSQMLSWRGTFSLVSTLTYMHTAYSLDMNQSLAADISANLSAKKWGSYTLGGQWMEEAGEMGAKRKGIYLNGSIPIHKGLRADLRLERNYLEHVFPGQEMTDEYLVRAGISYRW